MSRADKPDVPEALLQKWQRVVDLMARFTNTPAALITRAHSNDIEMLISSRSSGNPYKAQEKATRHCGLYCDQVIATQQPLLVRDASADQNWRHNPDMEHGLSFYLGYPLRWPDGEAFGTICVLDSHDNAQAVHFQELVEAFQALVNNDLAFLLQLDQKQQTQHQLEHSLQHKNLEVRARTSDLEEINTAMRILLNQRDRDKQALETEILNNLQQVLTPYLDQLEQEPLSDKQATSLRLLRQQLYSANSTSHLALLTPTEQQVATQIQQGHSSKEIANQMYLEKSTIDFHRKNIRQKLGLKNGSTSLKSYLISLSDRG